MDLELGSYGTSEHPLMTAFLGPNYLKNMYLLSPIEVSLKKMLCFYNQNTIWDSFFFMNHCLLIVRIMNWQKC